MRNRFFELRDDVAIDGRWHLGEIRCGSDSPRLRAGLQFNGATPLSAEITRKGWPVDFCLTSFAVPVACLRLAKVFSDIAKGAVQRLPLAINGFSDLEVLNVIQVVECLDERRSDFTKWTKDDHRSDLAGQYRMVTKLVIIKAQVPNGADCFRVKDWSVALIVSERLKSAMESTGFRGAQFVEV